MVEGPPSMARPYFLLALSMTLVGLTVALAKTLASELPVFVVGFLRCAIAALALVPFAAKQGLISKRPTKADLVPIVGQGIFGVFLFTAFLFYGVQRTNALSAGIISSLLPIVVAVLSFLWLKEPMNRFRIVGIGFAMAGVLALNVSASDNSGTTNTIGNILVFLAILSEGVYVIYAKRSATRLPGALTAFYVNLVGLFCFLPFALPIFFAFDWTGVAISIWGLLALYALTSSVFALVLWYGGVRKTDAKLAGLFTGFVPLSAGIIAITFLGERLTGSHIAGALLVLLGVSVGTLRRRGQNATPKAKLG